MKNKIKDLYDYFNKKYSSDRALASLLTLYGIYERYGDVDKTEHEYSLILEIVEGFANRNAASIRYVYSNNNRKQVYRQALEEFINDSKINSSNFDDWFEEAKQYKNNYNDIFNHWDVIKIDKNKSYIVIDLRDFLNELFDTKNLNNAILKFIKRLFKTKNKKKH